MELLSSLDAFLNELLMLLGTAGALLGCIFILFESIIPLLPLSLFITLNFVTFGNILGFIISWVFTVLGCLISYFIFKNGLSKRLYDKFKNTPKLDKIVTAIENISFSNLALLIAIPFTPAFMVNIAAGICRVDFKKYLYALLIGKISLVYFWGYIGVSILESFKNPIILIKIGILVLLAYVVSKILNKKLKIN